MAEQTDITSGAENILISENPILLSLSNLVGVDQLKNESGTYPNHLNLALFETHMRHLDGQRENITQEILPSNPNIGLNSVNVEGEAEVASTIYWDTSKDTIESTEVIHGNLSSVRSSFIDAFGPERLPLIEMHTHPHESLASDVDYQFMLFGDPEKNVRALHAILILCPKTQILALATAQTPIIHPDQLPDLLDKWNETSRIYEGNDGQYLRTLKNRLSTVTDYQAKAITGFFEKRNKTWEDYVQRIVDSGYIEYDQDETVSQEDENNKAELDRISARVSDVRSKLFAKLAKHSDKVFNNIQRQFVREMGIKLYASTDFRHFDALPE